METITISGEVTLVKSKEYIKKIIYENNDIVRFKDTKFESSEVVSDFFKNLPAIERFEVEISEQEFDVGFLKNLFDYISKWSIKSLSLSLSCELSNEILTEYVTKLKLETLEIYLIENSSTHKLINYLAEIEHLSIQVTAIDQELLKNLISYITNKNIKSLDLMTRTFNFSCEDLSILRECKLKSLSLGSLFESKLVDDLVVSLFENLPYLLEEFELYNVQGNIENRQLLQCISQRPTLKKLTCPQLSIKASPGQVLIKESDSLEIKECMEKMLADLAEDKKEYTINLSHLALGKNIQEILNEFISQCNSLESINLINVDFSELSISNPGKLKKISLQEIPINENFFSHLKQCTCLEQLEIVECEFNKSDAALIANLFDLPTLKTLSIISSALRIEHGMNIANNLAKTELEALTIFNSELTPEGLLEILKAAEHHEFLKVLCLDNNVEVEDNGLHNENNDPYNVGINEQILKIIENNKLEELSLDENNIQLTPDFRGKILTALKTNYTIMKLLITADKSIQEEINKLLVRNRRFKIDSRFHSMKPVEVGKKRDVHSFFQDSSNGKEEDNPSKRFNV